VQRFAAWRRLGLVSLALVVAHCRSFDAPAVVDESAGDDAGEAGEPAAVLAPPTLGPSLASQFGAVRLLVDGEPRCGGTLVTNSWVLTADQCVRSELPPDAVEIGLGADSTRFEQIRRAVEVVRFSGNDGTAGGRGRDLLLLGVDQPFVIDGSERVHHITLDPLLPHSSLGTLRCLGWDLSPDPASKTTDLRSELLTGVTLEYDVEANARAAGHRLWWSNDAHDPNQGLLPMPDDAGSGCFFTLGQTNFLTTVHSGNPSRLRKGGENDGREAFAQVVADPEVHGWLERTLFGTEEHSLDVAGEPGLCSLSPGTFELFATDHDGKLSHFHFDGRFTPRPPLPPPEGVTFSSFRPGAFCTPSGGIELFAVDSEGRAWQRSLAPESDVWSPSWKRLGDATTRITSGLAVVGAVDHHFHVFAAGESRELRHAEFERGWTGQWLDLGGALDGTPVARSVQEHRVDVFVRSNGNRVHQIWMQNGIWQRWVDPGGPITGDPIVSSWWPDRVDLLVRSEAGSLMWRVYDTAWGEWADTGLPIPEGSLVGLAPELGHLELVAFETGSAWRATWPRAPLASE